jgi:magnesium-transporting ATPase (P-type)
VDVLADCFQKRTVSNLSQGHYNSLLPSEISFVSAISGHLCAFRLRGVSSIAYMPTILAHGRASFEAATSATLFLMFGYLSFGFYVFFCTCSISKALPTIPIFCGVLYLQIVLPLVGLPITMSDPDSNSMHRVPPKNDPNITFGKREGKLLSWYAVLKALPPAILPQLLYLICLGEFMISFDSPALKICSSDLEQGDWIFVIRCNILHMSPWYEAEEITGLGEARQYASTIAFAEFMICTIVASAAYVHRTLPLHEEPPWQRNHFWVFSSLSGIAIALYYIYTNLGEGTLSMLPWYTFALFGVMPFLCLAFVEVLKRKERLMLDRAEKLRRLQFETRYVCLMRNILGCFLSCHLSNEYIYILDLECGVQSSQQDPTILDFIFLERFIAYPNCFF